MNRSPYHHTRDNPFSHGLSLTAFSDVTEADRRQILRIMDAAPKELSIPESGRLFWL